MLSAHVFQVYLTAYKIQVKYGKIGQFLYILNVFPLFVILILHVYIIHLWNWRGDSDESILRFSMVRDTRWM